MVPGWGSDGLRAAAAPDNLQMGREAIEYMRLFVSIDLPSAFAEPVADLQAEFEEASGLDFVDPTQAHVTLKFLGEVSEIKRMDVEAAIERAVAEAGVGPFSVTYGGLGVFPSHEYITVLWLGVKDGGDEMTRLHRAIEEETTEIGFDPETHDFTPHVTLARMTHAGGKELVQRLVRQRDPVIGETEVTEVRLTESQLSEDGPNYSTVSRYRLPPDA